MSSFKEGKYFLSFIFAFIFIIYNFISSGRNSQIIYLRKSSNTKLNRYTCLYLLQNIEIFCNKYKPCIHYVI